jgi:hypothetical protein
MHAAKHFALLFSAFFLAVASPVARAQIIEVRNGGTIEMENGGVWNLEGSALDLGPAGTSASISESGGGRFAGGRLEATRDVGVPSQANPAGLGLQISASADLGATTVARGHSVQTGNGNSSIKRYYEVSPSKNNSGLSAELTFSYNEAELGGLSESDLELFKSTDGGSTWSEEGRSGRDAQNNTVTLSGIESFSRWTLGSESSPLPVELTRFEGIAIEEGVRLTWQTASETNNAGFEVQRKAEQSRWKQVGYVESKAGGGTTTEAKSYRYVATGLPVGTHQFRLKQVDLDGTTTAHDPISVEVQMQEALKLTVPAPNPVSSRATLSFAVKEQARATVAVYDLLGRRTSTLYEGRPTPGESTRLRLDASGLPSGSYIIRLRAEGKTETQRFTIVR